MAYFTDIKTRLNKELRDSDNATFTDDEKSEALTRAIEEEVVATVETDATTLFTNGTRQYALNSNVRRVISVGADVGSLGNPVPIDADAYDFIAPNLTFASRWLYAYPTSTPLYITWVRKLLISDNIPDQIVPYVLNQAIYYTTEFLASGKVNRFLRNDVTMSEIVNRGQMAQRQALRLKKSLPAQRFVRV